MDFPCYNEIRRPQGRQRKRQQIGPQDRSPAPPGQRAWDVVQQSYYDNDVDLKTVTELIGGNEVTTTYTYDSWHNVISAANSGTGITDTYTYDTYGNNLTTTVTGSGVSMTSSAAYVEGNLLDYIIDASGNETDYTYTNDLLTQLTTGSTTYSFNYGSFALRSNVKIVSYTLASYSYTDYTNNL